MSAYFQIKARPKSNFSGKPLTITANCRSSHTFQCFNDLVASYKEMEPLTQKILDKGRETARNEMSLKKNFYVFRNPLQKYKLFLNYQEIEEFS